MKLQAQITSEFDRLPRGAISVRLANVLSRANVRTFLQLEQLVDGEGRQFRRFKDVGDRTLEEARQLVRIHAAAYRSREDLIERCAKALCDADIPNIGKLACWSPELPEYEKHREEFMRAARIVIETYEAFRG